MIDVFHDDDDDDDSSVEGHVLDELMGHHLQGGDLNLSLRTVVFRNQSSYETKRRPFKRRYAESNFINSTLKFPTFVFSL